ncbi:MAG: hypothetical protein V4450_04520 [Bacteroidota bacterium]
MRKIVCSILSLSFFSTTLMAQEDVSLAKWQSTPVIIDGNENDWEQPFNLFDNKSGLIFTISNDQKNLYLCFTDKEAQKAEKLMRAGWSIELISSEKKRKFDAIISFPKIEDPNSNTRTEFRNQVGIYKKEMVTVKAKGFVTNNGDIPLDNKDGISIGIGTDDRQSIVYEIAIPIKQLTEEQNLQFNELITLDITVNAMNKPAGAQSNTTRSGGFSGGGGRMGGGGGRMGGGRRGGNFSASDNSSADRSSLFDKVSFKQKIRLVHG